MQRMGGDGKVRVALAELLSLRARVGKAVLPVRESRSARTGQQHSRLYGRGMDYAESRVYQAGDDVRRLDWRLTARSGRLHTKLFQEEREGRLLILLDTHAGMHFGTRVRFKSVQAARAAAWAAWCAAKSGERIAMMGFGEIDRRVAPHSGPRGALAICGALADWDAVALRQHREPLSDAVQRASRFLHGASRVLLISDGGCCDEAARLRLLDMRRLARVGVLVVADALELAQAPAGRYPMEHAGERRVVALQSDAQRAALRRALGNGHDRLVAMAESLGLPCRSVDTAVDPFDATAAVLGARGYR